MKEEITKKGQARLRASFAEVATAAEQGFGGQALFELLIAMAVAVIIVTAVVAVVTIALRNATFSKSKAEATRFAQQAVEWVRGERDARWTTFNERVAPEVGSVARFCLNTLSWDTTPCGTRYNLAGTSANFKRDAILTRQADDRISVEVKLSWQSGSRTHTSSVATELTEWR